MDGKKNLVLSISGKDETKPAFDSVGKNINNTEKQTESFRKSLESMQPAFKAMATAGVVALGAISGFAIKTISDFGDSQKSAKQLEYAVLNVSHATKEQLEQTNALADALERKGVLDGDNIKMGLAQLSTFGLSNTAVQGLAGSLADLAVNQFGVTASGEQLSDTANMIAKALNGQFGVLEKSGIRFTEAQQSIIATGTELEKVKAINEGFAQNLKYTNDVALTTFEGKLAAVKVQLGNVSEGIGQALLPSVEKLVSMVTPIIEKMVDWIGKNQELTTQILAIGASLAGFITVIGGMGLVLPSVIEGLSMIIQVLSVMPFSVVTLLVASLVGGLILLYQNFDMVREKFNTLITFIEEKTGLITILKESFDNIVFVFKNSLLPVFQQFFNQLTVLKPFLELFAKIIGTIILGALIALIKFIEISVLATFKLLGEAVDWAIKKGEQIASVWDGWTSALSRVIDWIDKVIEKIKSLDFISKATSAISGFLGFDGARASGGPVRAGGSYLVGENGPERFVPTSSGTIIPNNKLGGGGGSWVINVSGNTLLDNKAGEKIGDMIVKRLKLSNSLD